MIDLYTPEQVRQSDAAAVAAGTPVATLMERAAGHLARAVVDAAGWSYGLRALFLCGKGNNGGDGIAAASRLAAMGGAPLVCLVAGEEGLNDLGREQLARYRGTGGREVAWHPSALAEAHVAVDCLLGTGTAGAPREPVRGVIGALNTARDDGLLVVACDLPSGVNADTGAVDDIAVQADLTITFGAHKRGLWLSPAKSFCGDLLLGPIGIPLPRDPAAAVLDAADVASIVPALDGAAEKRSRGTVVVVAGSDDMSGAAVLCALGAMAGGAGLVQVTTTSRARAVVAAQVPEALTLELPDDADGAFELVAEQAATADALVVGPGLTHDERASTLVHRIVGEVDVPLVLDADGLNVFRGEGDRLADHAAPLLCVTPHQRELLRLLGTNDQALWTDRISVVPDTAGKWNAVVVAKGAGSIVASPDGRVWINPTGTPALATGGSGDVLAGLTAALLARGTGPETVAAGVWLHGRAGELAQERRSMRSVVARDVAEAAADALAEVGR